MAESLPDFVPPMLARIGKPFDADDHLFEAKWDGFRALAFVEAGGVRVLSRRRNDLTPRYPETAVLEALPVGTLLDGELVCMRDGRVDFEAMLQREQARSAQRIEALMRTLPVAYVAFDVLYERFASCMDRPLVERRARLARLVAPVQDPRLVLSEGVVGTGHQFFEETRRLGIEGMVAKDLNSSYESGQRSGAWTKIKQTQRLLCVVLGYVPDESGGLKSLVIGSDGQDGTLRCVGRVGSGLTDALRAALQARLDALRVEAPLIDCGFDARWATPEMFCTVRFLEWTSTGTLRAPVFDGLADSEHA